jgi:hypothetical protein
MTVPKNSALLKIHRVTYYGVIEIALGRLASLGKTAHLCSSYLSFHLKSYERYLQLFTSLSMEFLSYKCLSTRGTTQNITLDQEPLLTVMDPSLLIESGPRTPKHILALCDGTGKDGRKDGKFLLSYASGLTKLAPTHSTLNERIPTL